MTTRTLARQLVLAALVIPACFGNPAQAAPPDGPLWPGAVIERLPRGYEPLRGGLFVFDGFFFRPARRGFRLVRPPVGTLVPRLPAGSITITLAGLDYYFCNGIYYRPVAGGYEVVTPPEQIVWVSGGEVGDQVVVKEEWLNLRRRPDKRAEIVKPLPPGTVLTVKAVGENWYYVRLDDGATGWVIKRYVRLGNKTPRG